MYEASEPKTKAVVSVSEMARMVGPVTGRFYQLIGTTFPGPSTTFPADDHFMTKNCKRSVSKSVAAIVASTASRSCSIRGGRSRTLPVRKPKKSKPPKDDQHADLLDGLKGLGLATATAAQVAEAIKELYPQGVDGLADGEVLRAVFLHLRRQNTRDNVGK